MYLHHQAYQSLFCVVGINVLDGLDAGSRRCEDYGVTSLFPWLQQIGIYCMLTVGTDLEQGGFHLVCRIFRSWLDADV